MKTRTYEERAASASNDIKAQLLNLMASKKSNLAVSVDLAKKQDLLRTVDLVGPYVCMVKTHIDIVEDFDQDLITQLQKLSAKHNFVIFEDRKFADIGNTVKLQYASGVYRIASWAHIVNAHTVPGEGIIKGLASVGLPLSRGLLLLAEMSSVGNLAQGAYTEATIEMAKRNTDFVIGFIAMKQFDTLEHDFLILTPGVSLESSGDTLGQSYRTPDQVVYESGCDVAIVGRGIYGNGKEEESYVVAQAQKYQQACWQAYEKRIA